MIYNKDCLIGMLEIPDSSIDFILTDLPYGMVSYKQDKKINLAEMWKQFKRILKPCAVVALFGSGKFSFELAASNFEQYKYKWVWAKNYSTLFIHSKNRPMSAYEEILIFFRRRNCARKPICASYEIFSTRLKARRNNQG